MSFSDYCMQDSQLCVSKNILSLLTSIKFIKEPYAWFLGQTLQHLLIKTEYFNQFLKRKINELQINFDFPIVG